MGARQEVDYSTKSVEELCQLWELSQRLCDELLTSELLAEFGRRSEQPAMVVHDIPRWLRWLPRLFWHQKPRSTVGRGSG